ncbi:MAG: hypothetical protein QOG43_3103 [Actinomycetota bacterium]|nr:hypothetical protein [Actinomycetota bacterium]
MVDEIHAQPDPMDAWNDTAAPYPRDEGVHHLVARQAARTPLRTAVEFEADHLSFHDLDERANRLAHHLIGLGVGPGVLVGVCVERSLEMVVGLLAVLRAGGAYVPLDPTYPPDRVAYMLSHSNAPVLLTQERLVSQLPDTTATTLCIDRDWPDIALAPATPPQVGFDPEGPAYVIYTSGSTGLPKGVQIPHRALVNFLTTMGRRPGLEPDDVLVAVTTLSFDIAGLELWLPLITGARLVVASRQVAADARQLAALVEASGASTMQATPTTWQLLVNDGWRGRAGFRALCGGEPLPVALAEALLARGVELWNLYGPTETTIWSTVDQVRAGEAVTIGRPIGNTTLYVLDPELQQVPVGTPGELHIGGDGLALGYLHADDLTAERFIPHPFDPTPGARIYKTGDLARWRPDGRVEHLGRLDHQVKIRGFRIELGEIETVLGRDPSVATTVVVAREDVPGEKRLVAYATAAPGATPSGPELRKLIAAKLPSYMVPTAVVVLDTFPLTPNGKIDRKALPAPESVARADDERLAPRTALEVRLKALWEDVLGVAPIGITEDFFELGVTSITAARLFARIEAELGADLPLGSVFEAPTIERLAAVLQGGAAGERWSSLVRIQPDGSKPPLFCVHGGAGTILHLHALSRRLGGDQPFYGLQMRGLYGKQAPHGRIEDMATHYLRELREVQPTGPYHLAGYCFGGIVAYEMAQQLVRDGEQVALVAMFNGAAPAYLRAHPGPISRHPLPTGPAPSAWDRHVTTLKVEVRKAQIRALVALRRPVPESLRDQAFFRICYRAERAYDPQPYPGTIVQFRSAGLFDDPQLGWGGLPAAGIEDFEVPGEHLDQREAMREPLVGFVGEHLAECLERAHRRHATLRVGA